MKIDNDLKQAIAEQARKELAKRYFTDYVEFTHHGLYKHARHTKLICNLLTEILNGRNKRIIITMPPRHSKSMTITETFPSFFLLNNPDKRVIVASYSDELAKQFGRRNKQKFVECSDWFNLALSNEKSTSQLWEIAEHRGGMLSTAIGGAITGQGADLLLIDDPVKNAQEATSLTYRNRVYNEYQATLRTRLHPGGNVVIILTRWHEDDLAGRLLGKDDEDWELISLPAICESKDDLLNRKIGNPLWADHGFDKEWAEQTKREVGSRTWAALYQQRPSPAEGNIIKRTWWKYYSVLPRKFDRVIQSWDFSFKETQEGSFVVGQLWGKVGADTYLIDQWRDKADFVKSQNAIIAFSNKHPNAYEKLVEDKANGSAIISSLKQTISGIIPILPTGTKEARAYAVTPHIESGNVYLPSSEIAPWIDDFITECTMFPNGLNDDQVDCMTQALNRLYQPNAFEVLK